MPVRGPLGQGRPARNSQKALEKLAKWRQARKPVYVLASISAAQGRSGEPLGRPAPPFPAWAAPLRNLAKTLVKPYDPAVCAGGLLGARPPGAELTRDPAHTLKLTPNL